MSEWQNEDFFAPNFQDVCQDACAVSNPEGMDKRRAFVLTDDSEIRSAAFSWARRVIGKGGTYAVEAFAHGAISDDSEILEKASECVERIRKGQCAKYVIAGEEVSEHLRGIMSKKFHKELTEE